MFAGVWIVFLACQASPSASCVERFEVRASSPIDAETKAKRQRSDRLEDFNPNYTIDPITHSRL